MNPTTTKLIDQYLSGELNAEDIAYFEERMANSTVLQKEVELQQSVMDAAKRAAQRAEVKKSAKQYRTNSLIKNAGLSLLVVGLFTATTLLIMNAFSKDEASINEIAPISKEVKDKIEKNQDFENVPIQYFQIPEKGSVQLSKQGVLISVPESAFLKDGVPFKGNVILQYQEAIRGIDIIKSGLSTMTGDDLLETQGMFSVGGYTEDGEQLEFNPEVGVYIQSPIDECKEGMQLYDGEKREDGSIDWVSPVPLNKIPTPVKMADLDFYPAGYEDVLAEKKWKKAKESRDSLYLSLEHTLDAEEIAAAMAAAKELERSEEESDAFRLEEMPKTYMKRDSKRDPIAKIDDIIAWEFSSRLLNGDLWEITGNALIRPGYYVRSANDQKNKDRTRIIAGPSPDFDRVGVTEDVGNAKVINTNDGKTRGFEEAATFKFKVKIKAESQIEIPIRYIFQIGNKDLKYPLVLRKSSLILGQSPEQIKARQDSLSSIKIVGDFILPSKVMGFWNKSFDNTNLATREFESRMKAIHTTCDNEVLNLYMDNLKEPISSIDKMVVKMGYPEFQKFADQNVGKVESDNPHLENLTEFYEKAVSALRADSKRKVKSKQDRLVKWNEYISNEREKERKRTAIRNELYVDNMKNFNRQNLMRQMATSNGFLITKGSFGSPIARRNCDRWRPMGAVQFSTAEIDTTETRYVNVQAEKYNDFSINIPNADKYVKLYMYVFPDKLNSYQRLAGSNGSFECRMNDKITYAVGVVGITENGYEYFEKSAMKGGDLGTVKLKKISEKKLDKKIEQMNHNRLGNPINITKELEWLKNEQANYKEQNMYRELLEFRHMLKLKIFPCVSVDPNSIVQAEGILQEDEMKIEEAIVIPGSPGVSSSGINN